MRQVPAEALALHAAVGELASMSVTRRNGSSGADGRKGGVEPGTEFGEGDDVGKLGRAVFARPLSARALVEMVTRNPARALAWEGEVGRIAPGLRGDLLLLRGDARTPYRALVDATERDVALVVVGGDPLWGDVALLRSLKPRDYELVESGCGFTKAVDATGPVPKGEQTVAEMRKALADALGASRHRSSPVPTVPTSRRSYASARLRLSSRSSTGCRSGSSPPIAELDE